MNQESDILATAQVSGCKQQSCDGISQETYLLGQLSQLHTYLNLNRSRHQREINKIRMQLKESNRLLQQALLNLEHQISCDWKDFEASALNISRDRKI